MLPEPGDFLLAIEVADTTLHFDRTVKARLYARHRVAELWIVDVDGEVLLRHLDPSAEGYATVTEYRAPDAVACRLLSAARIELGVLFAP